MVATKLIDGLMEGQTDLEALIGATLSWEDESEQNRVAGGDTWKDDRSPPIYAETDQASHGLSGITDCGTAGRGGKTIGRRPGKHSSTDYYTRG